MKLRNTAIALGLGVATFSALSLLKVNREAVIGATFVSGSAAFYFSKKNLVYPTILSAILLGLFNSYYG